MQDELAEINKLGKTARKVSVGFLVAAFLIMGSWGFTPLKNILPALFVLGLFGIFCVFAVAFTILGLYRDVQAKAINAKIEDA